MAVYKDNATNTWRAVFRYTDWQGNKKQTQKRGFPTKREAQSWEREQLNKTKADLDMSFSSFIEIYSEDMKSRIKENTWLTKEHIIRTKILPYFQNRKICDIQPKDVIAWQNEMINHKDKNGKPYSPVYLKTLHNQLSAIFNHAVKYYGLSVNPAAKVGNMKKHITDEKTGISYTLHGDYYLPNLKLPAEEERPIGIWGQRHLRYIHEYRKGLYNSMLLSGKLNSYLAKLNEQAEDMFFRLVEELAEKEGITETLKADNQMLWVQRMNVVRETATEIVDRDLIYT